MSSPEIRFEGAKLAEDKRHELREVIAMSVPMVITTCSPMVMQVADFWMVSRLGRAAQAAILPAQMMIWIYIAMGMGLVLAVNTFASQCLGKGRLRDCSAYAWQGLYLSIFLGVVGFGVWPLLPSILNLVGHEPAVRAMEMDYMWVMVYAIGPTIAAAALSSFFNGVHKPKVTMWSAIEANALNIALDYCLIFGAFGFPELGIRGAAYATFIAVVYRTVRLTVTMCGGHYRETYASRETYALDMRKIRGLLRVGAPQGGQWLSDVIVWSTFVSVLIGKTFGTAHLAATNIAWQYMRISFMPTLGVGIALTSMVGKAIGQEKPQRAIRLTRITLIIAMAYMLAMSAVYLFGREWLISLFTAEPDVIAIGATVLICAAVFQVFDAMGMIYNSALRGAGDTFWPAVLFVVSHWLIVIGGGYLVVEFLPQWGSTGPWIAASGLIIFVGLALWFRWHGRKWMKIDIFKYDKEPDTDHPAEERAAVEYEAVTEP